MAREMIKKGINTNALKNIFLIKNDFHENGMVESLSKNVLTRENAAPKKFILTNIVNIDNAMI